MSAIKLNLSCLTYGAASPAAYIVYCALEEEQQRLITLLAQEHAAQCYEDAYQTNAQLDQITGAMREITRQLSLECESQHLQLLKVTKPVSYESLITTASGYSNRIAEQYDERYLEIVKAPVEEGGSDE